MIRVGIQGINHNQVMDVHQMEILAMEIIMAITRVTLNDKRQIKRRY